MKTLKNTLLLITCLVTYAQVNAHALWIETPTYGKKGITHEVKIFYGEFAIGEHDAPEKWYSDVKDFELWLVAPDGTKTALETKVAASFYSSSFTPEQDGVYTLLVSHEAAELGGTTKYHFIASANVTIGKEDVVNAAQNTNVLKVYTAQQRIFGKSKKVKLYAQLDGQAFANKPISIASPEGWTKEFTTDADGAIEFSPIWPGRYMAEAQNFENVTGTHRGKNFDASWIGATFSFEVK